MHHIKQTLSGILLLFVVSCVACKTPFPYGKTANKEKALWQQVLSQSESSVKDYWIELIDGDFDFLQEHHVLINESDLARLKLKPALVYYLDSSSLASVDTKSSLAKMLTLDKTKAANFGMLDDTARVVIFAQYLSDKWSNGHGYSPIWGSLCEKVSNLLTAGIELYQLDVIAFPSSGHRFRSYIFYVNNSGEFLFLNQNGKEGQLKKDLISLKLDFIKGEKGHPTLEGRK